MDVTSHELHTIELPEAWRGYRQDDVDRLLDRVAETIEHLEGQVRRLTERLARAEEEMGLGREADEMLRRTLLLAQRTADAAVSEAQERARRLLNESEQRARSIVSDAEEEARRASDVERHHTEDEVRDLARRRDLLRGDVEELERIANDYRDRLRAFFEHEIGALEQRDVPSEPIPELHDVELPEEGVAEHRVPDAQEARPAKSPDPLEAVLLANDDSEADVPVDANVAGGSRRGEADLLPRTSRLTPEEDERFERGPGPLLDDDEFFAELRRAVEDDTPLGPPDLGPEPPDDPSDDPLALHDTTGTGEHPPGRLRSAFRRRS